MHKLLEELYTWKFLEPMAVPGTTKSIDDFRLDKAAVKLMLKTGQPPWGEGSAATAEYWGKLAHRCKNDLDRCKEELLDLIVQKRRLKLWLEGVLGKIGEMQNLKEGLAIIIGQKKNEMGELLKQLNELKWE